MMDHRAQAGIWLGGMLLASGLWMAGAGESWAAPAQQAKAATPTTAPTEDLPRRHYTLANRKDEVIGGTYFRHRVTSSDTMIILARDNHLGFNEIMLANPDQDPWSPRIGSRIRLDFRKVLPGLNNPARIVVNLPEMRLYHFRGDSVDTYPLGVGQEGMMTPRVRTSVTSKMADPIWRPPASIRKEDPNLPEAIYPGPRNPLGTHAVYLSLPSYLIHGTNRPLGVGRRVSHGCIRLYPEDIIDLFPNVHAGDSVAIVNEPAKAGWRNGELYLEVYPILSDLKQEGSTRELMEKAVKQALTRRPDLQVVVDWRLAERMADNPDGQSRRVAVAANVGSEGREVYLTVPEIPEEQTIPAGGLRLPNLEQLDREDGNPAAIRIDLPGSAQPAKSPAGSQRSATEPMPPIGPEAPLEIAPESGASVQQDADADSEAEMEPEPSAGGGGLESAPAGKGVRR
ncbi:MAG: L,D-transpeptidase family protein [Magnetococcales bacterium]|nr:L,D-transpeptidase family protein [Magnetococcales bacterium]